MLLRCSDNQYSLDCQSKVRLNEGELLNTRSISLKLLSRGLTISNVVFKSSIRDSEHPSEDLLLFERDIVPGPIDLYDELSEGVVVEVQDRIGRQFLNTVVGRYANRLPAGKSTIKLIDRSVDLDLDENESFGDGRMGNCLHGGNDGFDLKDFVKVGADSEIVKRFEEETRKSFKGKFENIDRSRRSCREERDEVNVHDRKISYFYLKSPAGHQGFPESLDILATISISINDDNDDDDYDGDGDGDPSDTDQILLGLLKFDLKAMISSEDDDDGDGKRAKSINQTCGKTPVNLTWHTGYLLNDFSDLTYDQNHGIRNHQLWINSDYHLVTDDHQLPTGEIAPNSSQNLNLNQRVESSNFLEIKDNLTDKGLDHCFLFNRKRGNKDTSHDDDDDEPKVILKRKSVKKENNEEEELMLIFRSNQSSIQCYTSEHFSGTKIPRKTIHRFKTDQSLSKNDDEDHDSQRQNYYNSQDVIFLEFQEPVSICLNEKLRRNVSDLFSDPETGNKVDQGWPNQTILSASSGREGDNEGDEDKVSVYWNWFSVEVKLKRPKLSK